MKKALNIFQINAGAALKHCFMAAVVIFLAGSMAMAVEQTGSLVNGNGNITYTFDGPLSIWDISGTYSDSASGLNLSYVMTQDQGGKITGSGNSSMSMDGVSMDMSFDVKGKVCVKDNLTSIKLNLKGKGSMAYEGQTLHFSFSECASATVDSNSHTMTGTVKVRVSAMGHSESTETPFDMQLPADMNGTATLNITCQASGKKILGTGMLTLSNGELYNFETNGTYSDKRDESYIKLKSGKCNLKLKISEANDIITSLRGKVLGQKLAIDPNKN